MECKGCDENQGNPVQIEYTDGTSETVFLCAECRDEFTDGGLVRDVESTTAE